MTVSRNLLAGLFAFGLAADPAFSAPIIYTSGPDPAEACAMGVAEPGKADASLKRLCEQAARDTLLSVHDRAASLANSGIVDLRMGHFEEAFARLEKARRLDPGNGDIAISLAATLIRLNRPAEAVTALSDLSAVSPDKLHVAHYNRGLAHWVLEDIEAAHRDFLASAGARPDYTPASEALAQFRVTPAE